jgi:hypothetical protein
MPSFLSLSSIAKLYVLLNKNTARTLLSMRLQQRAPRGCVSVYARNQRLHRNSRESHGNKLNY